MSSIAIAAGHPDAHAAAQASSAQARESKTGTGMVAFVDVAVVPMDTDRVVPNQTVLIENGVIKAFGPSSQVSIPAPAARIDGRGKYLIPGLADMHAHLGPYTLDTAIAERWLLRYALAGVTTIRNTDYKHGQDGLNGPKLLRLRARAAAGDIVSPRLYTSGPWGPEHYIATVKDAPAPRLDSVAAYIAAYKAAGYDFVKVHDESTEMHDSVAAAARRVGIPVAGHMPDHNRRVMTLERFRQSLTGMRSTEHLSGFRGTRRFLSDSGAQCASADSARGQASETRACELQGVRRLAEAMRRASVWSVPTLVIKGDGANQEVKVLLDVGVGLLLGTDAIPAFNRKRPAQRGSPAQVHEELEELVRAGLTPYQALATGTRNVAQYFGTLGETGTIAVGKRADVVLLNANPLDNVQNTKQLAGVMLGGRWLARTEIDRLSGDHSTNSGHAP